MVAYDSFQCCAIEYAYDLRNVAPTSSSNYSGVWFANEEGTSKDPYLEYSDPAEPAQAILTGTIF